MTVLAHLARVDRVSITGTFMPLAVVAIAQYNSNTARPTVGQTQAAWQTGESAECGTTCLQQDASRAPAGWAIFWQRALCQLQPVEHLLPGYLVRGDVPVHGAFQQATGYRQATAFAHQEAARDRVGLGAHFRQASPVRNATGFKHQDADRTKRYNAGVEWDNATPRRAVLGGGFQNATILRNCWRLDHQNAVPPPAGVSGWVTPPPPDTCYTPNPQLLFATPWGSSAHLVFQCGDPSAPVDTIIIPIQRVYIVLQNAYLLRVSDNAPVPCHSVSLSLDADSWAWGFDATVPGTAQALIEPDNTGAPVELLAVANGVQFRVVVEKMARERTFGRTSLRISGRSRNAWLDNPYAAITTYTNTEALTAQQLALDALKINGVPLPWALEWGLTDWLVPAGVWSHQGTHISALNAIAQSAGGYLQPHRTAQTLRILPRYPAAPWAWGSITPDFELPADVATREGIDWADKPAYNRVFVSGQQAGVLGQVTRAGTAGDVLAPMATDALITHADAARQRGISILADTGRRADVALSLPVLPATGVIEPGKLVRYTDGGTQRLGLVRATSVSWGSNALDLKQSITLETHP